MRCKSLLAAFLLIATTLWAQVQPPPAPWRGAGATPCVGSDGGVHQCSPAPGVIAVRAGRLFDSKTGQMLMRQVVLLQGERITDSGPEAQVKLRAAGSFGRPRALRHRVPGTHWPVLWCARLKRLAPLSANILNGARIGSSCSPQVGTPSPPQARPNTK